MNRALILISLLALSAALPGCIARTVLDVATAPVRVVGKAADLATTSQSEADEKRGRALRERDARIGKASRNLARHARACDGGDESACEAANDDRALIQHLEAAPY